MAFLLWHVAPNDFRNVTPSPTGLQGSGNITGTALRVVIMKVTSTVAL